MYSKKKLNQNGLLEMYQISLVNATESAEIATLLAGIGYTSEKIAEGKALYDEVMQLLEDRNMKELEESDHYQAFKQLKESIDEEYKIHRTKAKVAFVKDKQSRRDLGLSKSISRSYAQWKEAISVFYQNIKNKPIFLESLGQYMVTEAEIDEALAKISEMETAKISYLSNKGEVQVLTEKKNQKLSILEDWMSGFYKISKIAFIGKEQMMESLGKLVRS